MFNKRVVLIVFVLCRSLYREMLFLTLAAMGRDHVGESLTNTQHLLEDNVIHQLFDGIVRCVSM